MNLNKNNLIILTTTNQSNLFTIRKRERIWWKLLCM